MQTRRSAQRVLSALATLSMLLAIGFITGPAAAAQPVPQAHFPAGSSRATTAKVSAAKTPPRDPSRANVLVNKKYPMKPLTFTPRLSPIAGTGISLQPSAATAYRKLAAAARKDGISIRLTSGYRSHATQKWLLDTYTRQYGSAYANRIVAKPGTSEHQTGLSIDVGNQNRACGLQDCFAVTPVGRWMKKNAPKFGFILRYPLGMESMTGYKFEPWHYRYLGTDLAASYTASKNKTLEHYFGVTGTAATSTIIPASGTRQATANLNLRAMATTSSRVLITMPRGTKFSVLGSSGGWLKVKHGSTTGWVSGIYTKHVPASTATSKSAVKTTTVNLNLRKSAGPSGTVLATVAKGSKVTTTGKTSGDWVQVKHAGKTGWMSSRYLG